MTDEVTLCVVCAWRKDCQKKFSTSSDIRLRCPDFTRDLSIKDPEKESDKEKDTGTDKGGI
ncbi:MAG TPA: hypothetical protein PLW88_00355 [Syntrophorhabdaceae bacterium]|nr:hypothetical protein [Syntrophorhabdaceae bacterium]HPP05791.1 hypothetical protein [Syntrophorhabdaceae bacterium]